MSWNNLIARWKADVFIALVFFDKTALTKKRRPYLRIFT